MPERSVLYQASSGIEKIEGREREDFGDTKNWKLKTPFTDHEYKTIYQEYFF